MQHAVLHGDELTGASVFQLEEGLDTGPVYGTLTDEIRPADTSGDLLERLADSGAGLLVAVLDAIDDGTARAEPQPADGVSLAPKLDRGGRPGALGRARLRGGPADPGLHPGARPVDDVPGRAGQAGPGHAGARRPGAEAGRAAGGEVPACWSARPPTPVRLGEVRAAGKRAMPATDWARGVRVAAGEEFA